MLARRRRVNFEAIVLEIRFFSLFDSKVTPIS